MGTARSATLSALGLAQECVPNVSLSASASLTGCQCAESGYQGGFTCAGKRYCREMTSCEEAKFYLTQCGVGSLDGNRDGVPCETLCR